MNLTRSQLLGRLAIIAVFVVGCVAFCVYWFLETGGHAEGVNVGSYRTSFDSRDVNGLREDSEVRVAGVLVGRVDTVEKQGGAGGSARVEMLLDENTAPLHQGATVRIGLKDIIGSFYVDVVDGTGPALPDGTVLPEVAVQSPVELHDVVKSLRPETRAALTSTVRSLDAGSAGRAEDMRSLVTGLGNLGRNGYSSLDALAAQTDDLNVLTRQAGQLIDALDTGRGQIRDVVHQAQRITTATAGQQENLRDTIRQLPGVLDTANDATASLQELSGPLGDVSKDLRKAAPDLNDALLQLPGVAKDLRHLLPVLNTTLDKAPATLKRVPQLADDVQALIPELRPALADANPLLLYSAPYGRDISALLASFGRAMMIPDTNGTHPIRLAAVFNQNSIRNLPNPPAGLVDQLDPTNWRNAFPAPGSSVTPVPGIPDTGGVYPRVVRDPLKDQHK